MGESITNEEEKQALDEAKMSLISFVTRLKQINTLAGLGEAQMALEMIQRDIGPLHQRLSKSFDVLVKIGTGKVQGSAAEAESAFSRTLAMTISAAAIGVAVIGILGFLLGRSITRPLGLMQRAITRTATELDFTDNIKVESNDEVGATLQAYNELLAKLRSSFAEIQAVAERMASVTTEVGASQDSCRLIHAAHRVLFSAWRSRMTASRSGLSVTGPTGDQSRVFPDQRAGLSSRAWRYV